MCACVKCSNIFSFPREGPCWLHAIIIIEILKIRQGRSSWRTPQDNSEISWSSLKPVKVHYSLGGNFILVELMWHCSYYLTRVQGETFSELLLENEAGDDLCITVLLAASRLTMYQEHFWRSSMTEKCNVVVLLWNVGIYYMYYVKGSLVTFHQPVPGISVYKINVT